MKIGNNYLPYHHKNPQSSVAELQREHDPVISSVPVTDQFLSDHASVLCSLNSAQADCVAKIIHYRQLRAIDFDALRQDVGKSELWTREYSDLNELTSSYNSTLTSLLDKYAPMKEKVVVCKSACRGLTVRLSVL